MISLRDIASIQFGRYDQPLEQGNALYLQAKHFNEWGELDAASSTYLNIKDNDPHLLTTGDVLLVGKGFRNFAWVYTEEVGAAVASSIFFVIKVDRKSIIPEFLSVVFNSPETQSHFQSLGAGSSIPSIRKGELEVFKFALPPIAVQEQIVAIKKLHDTDMKLSRQLIAEKQSRFYSITHNLIHKQ